MVPPTNFTTQFPSRELFAGMAIAIGTLLLNGLPTAQAGRAANRQEIEFDREAWEAIRNLVVAIGVSLTWFMLMESWRWMGGW